MNDAVELLWITVLLCENFEGNVGMHACISMNFVT